MSVGRIFFAVGAALLLSSKAQAGQEVLFGPVPEWIEPNPVELPKEDGKARELPVRTVLLDNQVRMERGRRSVYSAVALRFQTPEGLSAGNLSLPWQADTDDLTIHRVVIHRAGETINVLGSGQTFTVLRHEQNLEQATLTGVLTANLFPEDLQVGDVLEVAMTITSANPVFGQHSEVLLGPMNAQADRVYARLQWPADVTMRLDKSDGMPDWVRSRKGGFEAAAFAMRDMVSVPAPNGAPLRFGLIGLLQASDFSTWAELAAHFAPLYAKAATLPAEGPLRAEVDRIRAASNDPLKQAEAALQLVEGRVRYVALAMGEGGLVPADAALTWSRRYGDCKAKTALLLAILHELGIEGEPVVVNTVLGDALPERLPMIGMFDHVLVRARIGGREYWLDGTRTGDTSLQRLRVPSFGWGLPLVPQGADLVRMMPTPLEVPDEDLAIHIDASKGVRGPLPTKIELVLRGDGALALKQVVANFVGDAQDRALREYWRDRFRDLEPKTVGQSFEEATGEMRLTLEGAWAMDWEGAWYETKETGVGYQADFTREPGPATDAPFAVAYPIFRRTRQTIVLPPGSSIPLDPDAPVDETVAGFEYKRRAALSDDTFFVERTIRSVAPEFAAADAPAAQQRLRELYGKPVHLRMPAGQGPAMATLQTSTIAQPDASPATASVADLMAEGTDFLDAGQYDEALARFTRVTELDPANANAWADRGIALAWKGFAEEALVDLNRAAALDPQNATAFRGRGIVAERRQDLPAAIAAFTRAIELDPTNAFAWGHRAMAHMGAEQTDRALADATEATRLSPQWVEMYSLRAFIFAGARKNDKAVAEVEAMLTATPDDPLALSAAGNVYAMLGLGDRARELIDRSVNNRPTPIALLDRARMRDAADTTGKLADVEQALELTPGFPPALAARAELRAGQGDLEGALTDLTTAMAEYHPAPRQLIELQANLARMLGRKEVGLAAASTLVANEPDSTGALVQASRIYAGFGMYPEAVATVDKALAISPEPFLYIDRSAAHDPADFDARLADIDEALRRAPNYGGGLRAKAALLAEGGDNAGALRVFGQAIALQPADASLLNQRGIALAKLGRGREAERDFAQAEGLVSNFPDGPLLAAGLNNFCYPKAVANVALERALSECEKSLRVQPDAPAALDSRGTVLLRMGRLEEAIRDFDKVLAQAPAMATTRYLRALALARNGDLDTARGELEVLRRDNPLDIASAERQGFVIEGGE